MSTAPSQPPPDVYGTEVPQEGPERDRYGAEVMRLAAEGVALEFRHRMSVLPVWWPCGRPEWNWSAYDYRILASSRPRKTVPWDCPQDVLDAGVRWFRYQGCPVVFCISALTQTGIEMAAYRSEVPWARLNASGDGVAPVEWSPDGKTWHPCTKQVPA